MTDAPETEEDEFSLSDLEKLQPIFTVFFILVQFALMFGLIWTGWRGFPWYLIIPLGGVLWFGNQTLKRMFRNQFETLIPEAKKAEAIAEAVQSRPFDSDVSQITTAVSAKHELLDTVNSKELDPGIKSKSVFIFVLIATIFPAALWYGVGRGLAKIFS